MSETTSGSNFIGLTAEIVSAYVSNNSVSAGDLPALINQVHSALSRVSSGHSEAPSEPLKPAISVKRSITPDHIVCLEDGKKFKSLKRHLRTQYNMTPEAYREKWDLPPDYPMVAPNYAAARSQLDEPGPVCVRRRKPELHGLSAEVGLERGRQRRRGVDDEQVAGPQDAAELAEAHREQRAVGPVGDEERDVVPAFAARLGRLVRLPPAGYRERAHAAAVSSATL